LNFWDECWKLAGYHGLFDGLPSNQHHLPDHAMQIKKIAGVLSFLLLSFANTLTSQKRVSQHHCLIILQDQMIPCYQAILMQMVFSIVLFLFNQQKTWSKKGNQTMTLLLLQGREPQLWGLGSTQLQPLQQSLLLSRASLLWQELLSFSCQGYPSP
jgi:hypothetical protein